MLTLTHEVSYPPNAQMRLAASFVRFLRRVRQRGYADSYYDPEPLADFWEQYQNVSPRSQYYIYAAERFGRIVQRITRRDITWCEACECILWIELSHNVGQTVCSQCYQEYSYCDHCEECYHNDSRNEHEHPSTGRSKCVAPHLSFKFPVRCLDREIQNDERVTVTLPTGHISPEGLDSIFRYVYAETQNSGLYYALADSEIGTQWVTREGNFPKRVAKLCLQNGTKLTPTLLTQIGNLAKQHTSTTSDFDIEVTRDFSAGARAFMNAGSCWFNEYWQSLCIFKQCGGLALRTFGTSDDEDEVSGRAWIMPFTYSDVGDFKPTHVTDVDVYVLFNVYGLAQFEAAHILAQMTAKSYRKIRFGLGRMYVNSSTGFLIASQQVCQNTDLIEVEFSRQCGC